MRIATIGLLALVLSGALPPSIGEAQSPEICAPVEQLDNGQLRPQRRLRIIRCRQCCRRQ